MPDLLVLPELARSLRTFGATRDPAGDAAHAAIFSPLLDARARATLGDAEVALSALRGEVLAARIGARVAAAAGAGQRDAAAARARAAQAGELIEPLRAELLALDLLANDALGPTNHGGGWQAWIAQLRRVFALADDACGALARLLGEPAAAAEAAPRWFAR
ncbi:MAG TPA: hypothetical protein VM033_04820 [Gemmatimonadaceae bacterium]|nr:hypothetical protein [Gemmatimonadaceae bacterium]